LERAGVMIPTSWTWVDELPASIACQTRVELFSTFKEMPDDRDHRDDEEDVNKPTSHREYKEPQRPEND
jgi:hypothetical protein